MEKPADFQERYDKAVKVFLSNEHRFFLSQCKRRGLIIAPNVESFNDFLAHAKNNGYLLGQKVSISNDKGKKQQGVFLNELVFRFRPTIGKQEKDHGKVVWKQVPTPEGITGFGLNMNLLGWSKLLDINLDDLCKALKSKSVEQIYAEKFPPVRYVILDGEKMTVNKALESSGCDKRSFWRGIDEIAEYKKESRRDLDDSVYQSVFDDVLKKCRPRIARLKQHGIIMHKSLWWVHVSDDDKKLIEQQSAAKKQSPSKWLHDLLQPYSYQ